MKTIQMDVVKRFMNEEELASFEEKYKANLKNLWKGTNQVATELDKRILSDFREGKTTNELAKFYKISEYKILRAIALSVK